MNKDKVTNICGLLIVVGGALIAADKAGQVQLGGAVDGIISVVITIATAFIGYMTGKPSSK